MSYKHNQVTLMLLGNLRQQDLPWSETMISKLKQVEETQFPHGVEQSADYLSAILPED